MAENLKRTANVSFKATVQDKLEIQALAKKLEMSVSEFIYMAVQMYSQDTTNVKELEEQNEFLSTELSKAKNELANLKLQSDFSDKTCNHYTTEIERLEQSNKQLVELVAMKDVGIKERDKVINDLNSRIKRMCCNIDEYAESNKGYQIGLMSFVDDEEIKRLKH